MSTAPVSASISTSHTAAPAGYAGIRRSSSAPAANALSFATAKSARHERNRVRADVAAYGGPVAQDSSLRIHRESSVDFAVAPLEVRNKSLGAVARPLHRPANALRRPKHENLLGVKVAARAEGAAHVLGHDADLVLA